ncbi:MAG: MATE family efflux transporter [Bacteroidales bacterium]|nr:MATE family efflux transporter [Bacteroidales bacterium]
MNKRILSLALPNIVTNITVPLLGMVDMAIVGHLSAAHIAAIAIGSGIFNLIYWNFGFLRMGTSGFTAQAYGAKDFGEAVRILVRAAFLALAIALGLLALQWPVAQFSKMIFHGSDTVMGLAFTYFYIRIWAAPATLGLYSMKGWFIGMQNSHLPMWIAIILNLVNIAASLVFVVVLKWGMAGVALGTVAAQYSGLALAIFFAKKHYGRLIGRHWNVKESLQWNDMRRFFQVNGDIFLRTVCLAAVFTFITAASGRISDQVLAINALLLQFFTLFSYFMDGFAYAGESLTGRYVGARDSHNLRSCIRLLLLWGLAVTLLFTGLYALWGEPFLLLFSNDAEVISGTQNYLFWTLVVPICGFAAFLFDGIFVGATASREMRNVMFAATAAFVGVYFGLKAVLLSSPADQRVWNNILWVAFLTYLSLRGILQAIQLKKAVFAKVA